jgi:glycosyltransferase involved in cell wall biosynthesis
MLVTHLTSSRFFGGPERQMLELAESLRPRVESFIISFSESGLCRSFLGESKKRGFQSLELAHDTPHPLAAMADLTKQLRARNVDILLCHGYKADLLGLWAARRLQIPVAAVSRGWTGESARVRFYEALDRRILRWMDRVVCVSQGQSQKVRAAGVPQEKITVIHNAVRGARFAVCDKTYGNRLQAMFPHPPRLVVGAAGRLSPEKGFSRLIDAAEVCAKQADVGFVLFGDGPLRSALAERIAELKLESRFLLGGFTGELDRYLPHFDIFAQSSYTEGLPNVILESLAAGVPVVATAVGGTPELVDDGENGFLVPAGDVLALSRRLLELLGDPRRREAMGRVGKNKVAEHFTFAAQSEKYIDLFFKMLGIQTPVENALAPAELVETS